MRLSLKLPLAFASTLLLVLSVALYGIYSLNQSLNTYETVVGANTGHERAIADMTSAFKTQVQEWKNTLIRGSNPKDLDKHWNAFVNQERDVAMEAQKLHAALPEGESKTLVDKFAQAHTKMGENYRKGFEAFTAAHFDPTQGDAGTCEPPGYKSVATP